MNDASTSLRIVEWSRLDGGGQEAALARPPQNRRDLQSAVADIIDRVRQGGDRVVRSLTEQFDGVTPANGPASAQRMQQALDQLAPELRRALENAAARIEAFHRADQPRSMRLETAAGLTCEARYLPISPVGLYVPGGSAPLVSTVLMLAIPARIAGAREVALCTPPDRNGNVPDAILAAAAMCGVHAVFPVGGAQAIAAMAYGTETIPRCRKLFGPGNAWVTEAKQQVALDPSGAAIDMPAGPSEVMLIADDSADPAAVAWDLLAQAEHGPDSQALLLTDCAALASEIAETCPRIAEGLPRADILQKSLQAARVLLVDTLDTALNIAERYAPEHLIINTRDAAQRADAVTTAGSVFIGPWTPESLGDYCSGTNHVLPTYGHARSWGALGTADFMRRMTLQTATREGLANAGPDAECMAAAEGLEAHRMAVRYRQQAIDQQAESA